MRLVREGVEQPDVRLEKLIGWAQNVAAIAAGLIETAPHFLSGLGGTAADKVVILVEPTDHTNVARDAPAPGAGGTGRIIPALFSTP